MLVYCLHNTISNKFYVGQTRQSTLSKRWNPSLRNSRFNSHLSAAVKKYGHQAFERKILAHATCQQELDLLERFFIATFQSTNPKHGYNQTFGGRTAPLHTEEVRERMSAAIQAAWRKRPKSERAPHRGQKKGPETMEHRRKISESVKQSWETRKKPPQSVKLADTYQHQIASPVDRKQIATTEAAIIAVQLRQVNRVKRQLKTIQQELDRIRYELEGGCVW